MCGDRRECLNEKLNGNSTLRDLEDGPNIEYRKA